MLLAKITSPIVLVYWYIDESIIVIGYTWCYRLYWYASIIVLIIKYKLFILFKESYSLHLPESMCVCLP